MEAEFELFEYTEIQKENWLVARLNPKVKQLWAKVPRKTADGKAVNSKGYQDILSFINRRMRVIEFKRSSILS